MPEITITPSDKYAFGARIDGIDIGAGIDDKTAGVIESALNEHAVICVSGEPYGPPELVNFSRHFGALEINVAKTFHHGAIPEVNVLSNRVIDGKPEGSPDAGQVWHTDLSYNRVVGRASILHAHQVPFKDGKALGDTAFRSMYLAYENLPKDIKERLEGKEACHEFEKMWTQMIAKGSKRAAYTDAQRAEKPPVVHPVFLTHPWTGRKCLFVNRGLTQFILGIPREESDDLLEWLFDYEEGEEFEYRHEWRVGDTVIWDNCATIHCATGGYTTDQHRVMIRTQVLGNEDKYTAANAPLGARLLKQAS